MNYLKKKNFKSNNLILSKINLNSFKKIFFQEIKNYFFLKILIFLILILKIKFFNIHS
jgi:hypothetical protein